MKFLLKINICILKGIRKNVTFLEVVGPTPVPPAVLQKRLVLLHTEGVR